MTDVDTNGLTVAAPADNEPRRIGKPSGFTCSHAACRTSSSPRRTPATLEPGGVALVPRVENRLLMFSVYLFESAIGGASRPTAWRSREVPRGEPQGTGRGGPDLAGQPAR